MCASHSCNMLNDNYVNCNNIMATKVTTTNGTEVIAVGNDVDIVTMTININIANVINYTQCTVNEQYTMC